MVSTIENSGVKNKVKSQALDSKPQTLLERLEEKDELEVRSYAEKIVELHRFKTKNTMKAHFQDWYKSKERVFWAKINFNAEAVMHSRGRIGHVTQQIDLILVKSADNEPVLDSHAALDIKICEFIPSELRLSHINSFRRSMHADAVRLSIENEKHFPKQLFRPINSIDHLLILPNRIDRRDQDLIDDFNQFTLERDYKMFGIGVDDLCVD